MNENDREFCDTEIGLLALLIKSGRQAEARLDDVFTNGVLTFVKWRVLNVLVRVGEPIPLKILPEQLGCVKSNVTQLIDKLEADGSVQRIPHPDDRRVIQVEITDAGRRVHHAGKEALAIAATELFGTFEHQDRVDLRRLLGLLGQAPG